MIGMDQRMGVSMMSFKKNGFLLVQLVMMTLFLGLGMTLSVFAESENFSPDAQAASVVKENCANASCVSCCEKAQANNVEPARPDGVGSGPAVNQGAPSAEAANSSLNSEPRSH